MSREMPHTLLEAAAQLRSRALSSAELTEALLQEIEAQNPTLHCFVSHAPEQALAEAKRIDGDIARGGVCGPLHGIPIALKDIIATRDYPTHVGSVVLSNWQPGRDSGVAAKLRAAGAIVIGKTTTTEAAFMEHHPSIRVPRNPWHNDYWTGVSSSGSGVATAAGLCFGALGTDTGGSIRFPAYCCGLVGLKPTWGRVSRAGVFPLAPSLDHIGPMARRVGDAAAIFEAIAGGDPADPTSSAVALDTPIELDAGVRGLRIGVDERYCSEGIDAAIAGALHDAAQILSEGGATLCTATLPSAREAVDAFPTLVSTEAALAHRDTLVAARVDYTETLRTAIEAGAAMTATEYAAAHHARLAFRGALETLFDRVDLYLAPVWARTTPSLAAYHNSSDSELAQLIEYTAPQNLAGVPCLSLPSGVDAAGVPFGFQLVGRPQSEALLLRAGRVYERARPPASPPPP